MGEQSRSPREYNKVDQKTVIKVSRQMSRFKKLILLDKDSLNKHLNSLRFRLPELNTTLKLSRYENYRSHKPIALRRKIKTQN